VPLADKCPSCGLPLCDGKAFSSLGAYPPVCYVDGSGIIEEDGPWKCRRCKAAWPEKPAEQEKIDG